MKKVFCRGCGKEIYETALTCPYCGAPQSNLSQQVRNGVSISAINYYVEVLKKYAVFSGRACRKEYWYFILFNAIASIVFAVIGNILGIGNNIMRIYNLAVLIPGIAVGVRRLHDTNRSGWWLLVPIANFIFWVQNSQNGDNKYGSNPKQVLD